MRWLIRILFILALCCCAGCVLPAHAAAPPIKAINLKLADLPAGFARSSRKTDATSDDEQFARQVIAGLLFVESNVSRLANSQEATLAYNAGAAQIVSSLKSQGLTSFKRLSVAGVGSHHIAYQGTGTTNGIKATLDLIVFQRGDYFTVLVGAGVAGTFKVTQVLKLAHIVDGRIKAAG
ncbi:MAG TPA: hypothetical protein VHB98_20410 [Chloroflexota bacterium]|nr:hypothetical protein [Chloroflexota bacterium]